ncbi:MAG: hypothetical protein MSD07_00065, partial [Bacteroidales bacterium]|nr:hypothetical protein [Bacteroidales bacterium]
RWHRQKDKNRSPSAKNQSSEIRLSENANKKRAKCEAFHVAPRLFFMFFVSVAPVFIHRAQILAYIKKKPERREYLFGSGIYKK